MKNNEVVGYITKILYRIHLYLKNKFDPRPPLTKEEIFCSQICLKLIELEDSELFYTPISNKRFIKNEKKNIFVVINHRIIHLINHVYGYNIMMEDDELYLNVTDKFDEKLEERRLKLEDELNKNIHNSLQQILDKVS